MTDQHHFRMAKVAEESGDFERVLWTGIHAQLVLLTVPPGEATGEQLHEHADQVFTVVSGSAEVVMEGGKVHAEEGDVVVVPRGIRHDVRSHGRTPLRVALVCAPPQHAAYGAYATRAEAEAAEESGEDMPPKPAN